MRKSVLPWIAVAALIAGAACGDDDDDDDVMMTDAGQTKDSGTPFDNPGRDAGHDQPSPDAAVCAGVLCGGCEPALSIHVTSSANHPVLDWSAHITRAGVDCIATPERDPSACVTGPGRYHVVIKAQGIQIFDDDITIKAHQLAPNACCGCGYEPYSLNVSFIADVGSPCDGGSADGGADLDAGRCE